MVETLPAVAPSGALAEYKVTEMGMDDLLEAINANLDGGQLSIRNLTRVKIPGAGGTSWQVPSAAGEEEVKTITGVPVLLKTHRVYFSQPFGAQAENQAPDCWSDDGVTGYGLRNEQDRATGVSVHDCMTCPLAKFGPNGERPACSERKRLFLLREQDMLPLLIDLPGTSLKGLREYLGFLINEGLVYWGAEMTVGLQKLPRAQTGAPADYSVATFTKGRTLSRAEKEQVKQYQNAINAMTARPAPDGGAPTGDGMVVESL